MEQPLGPLTMDTRCPQAFLLPPPGTFLESNPISVPGVGSRRIEMLTRGPEGGLSTPHLSSGADSLSLGVAVGVNGPGRQGNPLHFNGSDS